MALALFHPRGSTAGAIEARTADSLALDAQSALLPYALGFFGLGLPAFVWAGTYASDAAWLSAIFVQFSLNWAIFYAGVNLLGPRHGRPLTERGRLALHIGGGLLWVLAVVEITVFGFFAGPVRDVILAMAAASAVACFFFSAPSLRCLSIIGPAAAIPPLVAMFAIPGDDHSDGVTTCGALALAMVLCLILNRALRRQFAMAVEREALIDERARSLAEAERLAKSKSQILATLSHEIRNGLTGVAHVLSASANAGSGRAGPSREQLAAALGAARELLDVLNATLDTETAGAGRLTLTCKPFDAARLARSATLLMRPKAIAKRLEMDLQVDEDLAGTGAAIGDPVRVRQILSNLLGNAVKYTSRGRVEVRIRRPTPDRIRFEVADTGPGLTPEELERAFEPFSRIERVGLGLPGAGLGLSLSRDLARLMGGDVSAESAVGLGSRFWFDLPFDPEAVAAPEPPDADSADFDYAPTPVLRVLIAEDDALNAAMLRAILEQLGHQVVHAQDGRRALELVQFCEFDLIMLDGRMPHMSGQEAAREIRALSTASRDAPIVAVIGGDADEAQACLDAGADEVLRKPVTVSGVARAVAAAVSGDRRSADAPARVPARFASSL